MIEETREKTLTTKQIGNKMLENIEKEAFELYKEALDDKNNNEYYLYELAQKNEYLKSRVPKAFEVINKGLGEEIRADRKKKFRIMLLGAISIVTSIIAPAEIGIIVSLAYITIAYKEIKKSLEKNKNGSFEKEMLDIFHKVTGIMTNIENNQTFIIKRLKEASKRRVENIKEDPYKVKRLLEANLIIQDYLNYDRLPEKMDDDIKNTIINILRQDLNSNETSLEALLKEAKEKVSLDTLVKKLEFDGK